MEKWYVMRTVPGKEREAGALMERTIDKSLWSQWRVLKKQKLFRAKGKLFLSYGYDVSRLHFCQKQSAKRTGGGTKQIQGVSKADRK